MLTPVASVCADELPLWALNTPSEEQLWTSTPFSSLANSPLPQDSPSYMRNWTLQSCESSSDHKCTNKQIVGNVVTVPTFGFVTWEIGKRRLACKERIIVSPCFELFPEFKFRLQLVPPLGRLDHRNNLLQLFLKYEGTANSDLEMLFNIGDKSNAKIKFHNFFHSPILLLNSEVEIYTRGDFPKMITLWG